MTAAPATIDNSEAPSERHWPCERCRQWVLPRKPHIGWRIGEVCFWLSTVFALTAMKTVGVIAVPMLLVFSFGLAGFLRERAGDEPRCSNCNCYLPLTREVPKAPTP